MADVQDVGGAAHRRTSAAGHAYPGAHEAPRGKEFEQIVEFTEFDRPVRVHVHIVEGPYPIDGTWSFESHGGGTRVHFVADGELRGVLRMLKPVANLVIARQMAGYHRNLRRNVEAG